MTMSDTDAAAYLRRLAALEAGGERTTLAVGPYTAFIMTSALQLASRHPGMTRQMRATLAGFTGQLRTWFDGTPGQELLARGEDPAQDVLDPGDPLPACRVDWAGFGLADDIGPHTRPAAYAISQHCPNGHATIALACAPCTRYLRDLDGPGEWGCPACLPGAVAAVVEFIPLAAR